MWKIVGVLRLIAALPVLLFGLVVSPFIGLMRPSVFQAIARRWYRCLLLALGIHSRWQGETISQTALVVSNHISWADILVIGERYPYVFLAMKEVAQWPVVGGLARRAGTLFISRGSGGDEAVERVSGALAGGQSVIIFPEGRTSTGLSTSRFHAKIFEAAVIADVPVHPLALFYRDDAEQPARGSRITFADEAGFVEGIWRTVCGRPVRVDVKVFTALAASLGRHQLSGESGTLIREFVEFTASSPGLEDTPAKP